MSVIHKTQGRLAPISEHLLSEPVIVARMAREASDLDRYMAQPPVASAWLRRSELSAAAPGAPAAH